MTMILQGKPISDEILKQIKEDIATIQGSPHMPCLAIINVGNDISSKIYTERKQAIAIALGIKATITTYPEGVAQETIVDTILSLNRNPSVHGIIVQLPLPKSMDKSIIAQTIAPHKDVDGLNPYNIGKHVSGNNALFVPCTARGCLHLIKSAYGKEELAGKHAVIVGRSDIVGKPTAIALMHEGCTITIAHSQSKNLEEITSKADIVVVAMGKPKFIKEHHIKKNAVVIDVGITRTEHGLQGDVDIETVLGKARAITPVPAGVGPLTIAYLMENTYTAYAYQQGIKKQP